MRDVSRVHRSSQSSITWLATVGILLSVTANSRADVGPEPILLWPNGAPGAVGEEHQDKPQLRIYLPASDKATGAGIIVCPGGGYGILATDHEGHQVARWLNSIGVTAFVLKYRLGPRYRHPAPLQDAQRAMRHVRNHANKYGIDPHRIGIMGFSAGGHLSATLATHFDSGDKAASDPIERVSCRPDFAVLCYAVVSFTAEWSHKGSGRNLVGENPDPAVMESLSNEKQVTADTPPTFLFHTGEDTAVPVENCLAFYQALAHHGVPAELHVYQYGPHGVGLGVGDPVVRSWNDRLADWLRTSGFLSDAPRVSAKGKVTVDGKPVRWGTITFIPVDSPNAPIAWTFIKQGNYEVPQHRGVIVGECRVEIRSMGAFEPLPTIDDVKEFSVDAELRVKTSATGQNVFDFEF